MSRRLKRYFENEREDSYPFLPEIGADFWVTSERQRKSLGNIITRMGRRAKVEKFSAHSLRKFCATFWNRQKGEGGENMVNYVLRHSSSANGAISALGSKYISRLTDEEAAEQQDSVMRENLFL